MIKLTSFISVSADGYFTDANNDMSWAHGAPTDSEWNAFVQENAKGGGALMFGRVTFELMAKFWSTPIAAQMNPVVAERMNAMPKYVPSRTLSEPTWANTTILKGDLLEEVCRLKVEAEDDICILGSGSLVSQLGSAGLIDEFQIVVIPIVLGAGKGPFEGVKERFGLKLLESRCFQNGNVFLRYDQIR